MNNFNIDCASKQSIIESIHGKNDLSICSMPRILDRKEAIKQKYEKLNYLNNSKDKNEVYMQCVRLNSEEIVRILGLGVTIGGIAGAIIGTCFGNAPGACYGAGIGAGLGAGGGFALCYKNNLHLNTEYIKAYLERDNDYIRFKQSKSDEQYKLFTSFFRTYIEGKSEKHESDLEDCLCSLSYVIPEYPVFSVHDVNRLHVYEKAEIESHIEGVSNKLMKHLSESGMKPPYTTEMIQENYQMALSSDPFRMHPIAKKDLIYDPLFSKKVIKKLCKVLKDMEGTLEADQDPIIVEGVKCLITHYKKQYSNLTDKLINELKKDVFAIDGNFNMAKQAARDIRDAMNRV